ncbi:hypothetical protein HK405_005812 [Cladochytrium tenue]|nr:hypothetical protein HK405_005812 [Cladochytrium tenue]
MSRLASAPRRRPVAYDDDHADASPGPRSVDATVASAGAAPASIAARSAAWHSRTGSSTSASGPYPSRPGLRDGLAQEPAVIHRRPPPPIPADLQQQSPLQPQAPLLSLPSPPLPPPLPQQPSPRTDTAPTVHLSRRPAAESLGLPDRESQVAALYLAQPSTNQATGAAAATSARNGARTPPSQLPDRAAFALPHAAMSPSKISSAASPPPQPQLNVPVSSTAAAAPLSPAAQAAHAAYTASPTRSRRSIRPSRSGLLASSATPVSAAAAAAAGRDLPGAEQQESPPTTPRSTRRCRRQHAPPPENFAPAGSAPPPIIPPRCADCAEGLKWKALHDEVLEAAQAESREHMAAIARLSGAATKNPTDPDTVGAPTAASGLPLDKHIQESLRALEARWDTVRDALRLILNHAGNPSLMPSAAVLAHPLVLKSSTPSAAASAASCAAILPPPAPQPNKQQTYIPPAPPRPPIPASVMAVSPHSAPAAGPAAAAAAAPRLPPQTHSAGVAEAHAPNGLTPSLPPPTPPQGLILPTPAAPPVVASQPAPVHSISLREPVQIIDASSSIGHTPERQEETGFRSDLMSIMSNFGF